jgi:hypothetical protein
MKGQIEMATHSGIIFRKSARYDVSLPARVRVAEAHAGVVRFTAIAGVRQGWLPVDLVDFSSGGLGFLSSVFVPRRCILQIQIFGLEQGPAETALIDGVCRVQRVVMTDRRPAYLVGASFEQPSSELDQQITRVLEMFEGGGLQD